MYINALYYAARIAYCLVEKVSVIGCRYRTRTSHGSFFSPTGAVDTTLDRIVDFSFLFFFRTSHSRPSNGSHKPRHDRQMINVHSYESERTCAFTRIHTRTRARNKHV